VADASIPTPDLEELSRRFVALGELEARGYSPLYEYLALAIADDPELLSMLAAARIGQRRPTLFLAAANLLGGIRPGVTFDEFRAFCLDHREALLAIIETRSTQTNEVRRSAVLLPVFVEAAAARPISLLEVGASAGLNLLFDRYSYDYGGGRTLGEAAPVLPSEIPTDMIPTAFPTVTWRRGIDREPVDVHDDDAVAWLRACLWADQTDRVERFDQAVALAQTDPPTIVEANVLDVFLDVAAEAPSANDAHLVIFHTWVLSYFTRHERAQLFDLFDALGRTRDFTWISAEAPHIVTPLGLEPEPKTVMGIIRYLNGHRTTSVVGQCHPHGAWLRALHPN
jgi:hypothetical protein